MSDISKSIPRRDHYSKISGAAIYTPDYPDDDLLFARVLRSTCPHAKVIKVNLPDLPDGYYYIDKNDVTGVNAVHIVLDDTPIFIEETVEYIGDPIGMLAGPDKHEVNRLFGEIKVDYEELEPIFDVQKSDVVFFEFAYEKGDIEKAFAEADKIYEEDFYTGMQEQAYMETQGMIAEYRNGGVHVHGSVQCPYYVHTAVVQATGLPGDKVSVAQDAIGGGFGGKEDYPSVVGCQTAVAALKTKKKVRLVLEREEDITATGKRHPSFTHYKVAVKDKKVTGMQIEVLYDSGGYSTLSSVVLQRGIISAPGIYYVPNLKVRGTARKTNTVPNGAFRGFGGPQTFFSAEMMMTHIAKDLGMDPVEFKLLNVAKQGDSTSTGGKFHFPVPIPAMMEDVLKASDYYRKRSEFKNQSGRYRKGIGMSAVFHGCGFTGSGERDFIKAVAKLRKTADDMVEILVANTEMGQGLSTTFPKIVAKELNIPLERIIFAFPDTDRVPNSGPTVASRSVMVVGELLRRAAVQLREKWVDKTVVEVEEHYKHPEFLIPFDGTNFQGDAYPTYSWAVNAVEVEIDTLTGYIDVTGAWGSFDVGTPIDYNICIGQMEGGMAQSLGYGMMEKIAADGSGRIRNCTLSDYIIPTAKDFPNLHVMLYEEPYPEGPYGAKGAGELPCVAGAPAVIDAIQNALGVSLNKTPFVAEDVMQVLREGRQS